MAVALLGVTACTAAESEPAAESGSAVIESLRGLHNTTQENIQATAEMLSEDVYAFQPTEEVRTMGGILAHIANAQYLFCSAAAGEEKPNTANFEETLTTKAETVAALDEAFAYCVGVYERTTDARGAEIANFFGNDMAVAGILAFNSAHNYEHYGNLVTYMRLNGIVPPSSM
jgi:uncharacterized damage-inducible protein DinB